MMRSAIGSFFLFIFFIQPTLAQPSHMQVPRQAPDWVISEWLNGKGVKVNDLKGKVVVVDFFQLWCPGCNAFSIPLLKRWEQTFADEINAGKLEVISIHTVFEGHEAQNPNKLKKFLKRKEIHHLVGIDRHKEGERIPQTMNIYGTSGTPEMAFIDKKGVIRFQEFGGFNVARAEKLLRKLLSEPTATN
ncbi:MAG: TlpA family protein disulfide reductase [Rhodospirillales bacterium]|nr:TlpA family protein disulfide reductase [Rhodospirillales bacterium]